MPPTKNQKYIKEREISESDDDSKYKDKISIVNKEIFESDDDAKIDINEKQEKLQNIKSDRKLKINTQRFIKIILSICVGFTLALIGVNALVKSVWNKELYSEWFLSVLIGSQLIILPFSLLYIVAKHLFPNQDKDIR